MCQVVATANDRENSVSVNVMRQSREAQATGRDGLGGGMQRQQKNYRYECRYHTQEQSEWGGGLGRLATGR